MKILVIIILVTSTMLSTAVLGRSAEKRVKLSFAQNEEEKRLVELFLKEGQEGWDLMLEKEVYKNGNTSTVNKTKPVKLKTASAIADSAFPTESITNITSVLAGLPPSPLSNRASKQVGLIRGVWSQSNSTVRTALGKTIGVVGSSLEKFVNAKDDPIGAIRAGVDILASIVGNFGPKGQLIAMGLSLVSSILGLFGKKEPKPKPQSDIVREQINKALSKYKDQKLTSKLEGLITALRESEAYLNGVAETGRNISENEMVLMTTACRIPAMQGSIFMGEMLSRIIRMYEENDPKEAKKFFGYIELYIGATYIKESIFTKIIYLMNDDPNYENVVKMIDNQRKTFKENAKTILKKVYKMDFLNDMLPFYDLDDNAITDEYAKANFDLGKIENNLKGFYCIRNENNVPLDILLYPEELKVDDTPYVYTRTTRIYDYKYCFWKLTPHGNNIYGIVSHYKCDDPSSDYYEWCKSSLSWGWRLNDDDKEDAFLRVSTDDPVFWKIEPAQGRPGYYKIYNMWHCPGDRYCELLVDLKTQEYSDGDKLAYLRQIDSPIESSPYWRFDPRDSE